MKDQFSLGIIEDFQNYLQVDCGLAENSVFSYSYDLKKFKQFIEKSKKNLLEVKTEDVLDFLKIKKVKIFQLAPLCELWLLYVIFINI